jgi:hypothetical protein
LLSPRTTAFRRLVVRTAHAQEIHSRHIFIDITVGRIFIFPPLPASPPPARSVVSDGGTEIEYLCPPRVSLTGSGMEERPQRDVPCSGNDMAAGALQRNRLHRHGCALEGSRPLCTQGALSHWHGACVHLARVREHEHIHMSHACPSTHTHSHLTNGHSNTCARMNVIAHIHTSSSMHSRASSHQCHCMVRGCL